MTRSFALALLVMVLAGAASYPAVDRHLETGRLRERLARVEASLGEDALSLGAERGEAFSPDVALFLRVDERERALGPLLASWQTIGGCGAGSATGAGAGVKWIGRGATGGLFNVQCQVNYTRLGDRLQREHHFFVNTLVTRGIGDKWVVGANVPFVYKYIENYFEDPFSGVSLDLSNGGLGDVSLQLTRKFGNINDTSLTAIAGLPTGTYNADYRMDILQQHRQLGFGRPTAGLLLDHTMDEIWGVVVVGGMASYRGGKNSLDSYRAPSATAYSYVGYYLGPFVPALGLGLTGFYGHDRDQTQPENTGLVVLAANASIEWSTDWFAVLLGGSLPYQYDGIKMNAEGQPRSPWGFGAWMVAVGIAASPF
jgi:hypothetical protein